MADSRVTEERLRLVADGFVASIQNTIEQLKKYCRTVEFADSNISNYNEYLFLRGMEKLDMNPTIHIKDGYIEVHTRFSQYQSYWRYIMEICLEHELLNWSLRAPAIYYDGVFDIDYLLGPYQENGESVYLPYIQIYIKEQ